MKQLGLSWSVIPLRPMIKCWTSAALNFDKYLSWCLLDLGNLDIQAKWKLSDDMVRTLKVHNSLKYLEMISYVELGTVLSHCSPPARCFHGKEEKPLLW